MIAYPCAATPELFHSPDGERTNSSEYDARVAAAVALCARCPIQEACRQQGRELRATGVWGGETDTQRAEAGAKPKDYTALDKRPDCGTEGGAKWHRRHRTKVCDRCLEAERVASRERTQARAAAKAAAVSLAA